MIGNFDEVTRQLAELAEVINKFKSEAVQLRIVEIVLGDASIEREPVRESADAAPKQSKARKRKASRPKPPDETAATAARAPKKQRSSGQGAVSTLSELVDGGFFDQPKSINQIVTHCEEKLARRFKSNEFSGKLGRLTREGVLDRNKNADGQYEYRKIKITS